MHPVPIRSRADVERVVRRDYPPQLYATVLALLDDCCAQSPGAEPRVQLAVLKLAAGDVDKLLGALSDAIQDWRDVLSWAEYPTRTNLRKYQEDPDAEEQRIHDQNLAQYSEWLNRK